MGWSDTTPSARTATASRAELLPEEVDPATGRIADGAVDRICLQLEEVRSQSHAVRSVNLVSNLRNAIQTIGGQVVGVGANRAVYVQLPDGRNVLFIQQSEFPRQLHCTMRLRIHRNNPLPLSTIT